MNSNELSLCVYLTEQKKGWEVGAVQCVCVLQGELWEYRGMQRRMEIAFPFLHSSPLTSTFPWLRERSSKEVLLNSYVMSCFCPLSFQFLDRGLPGFCEKQHWEEKSCEDVLLKSLWFPFFGRFSTSFSAKICRISVTRDISEILVWRKREKTEWIHLRKAEHLHLLCSSTHRKKRLWKETSHLVRITF